MGDPHGAALQASDVTFVIATDNANPACIAGTIATVADLVWWERATLPRLTFLMMNLACTGGTHMLMARRGHGLHRMVVEGATAIRLDQYLCSRAGDGNRTRIASLEGWSSSH
jgi:hypothetical protein